MFALRRVAQHAARALPQAGAVCAPATGSLFALRSSESQSAVAALLAVPSLSLHRGVKSSLKFRNARREKQEAKDNAEMEKFRAMLADEFARERKQTEALEAAAVAPEVTGEAQVALLTVAASKTSASETLKAEAPRAYLMSLMNKQIPVGERLDMIAALTSEKPPLELRMREYTHAAQAAACLPHGWLEALKLLRHAYRLGVPESSLYRAALAAAELGKQWDAAQVVATAWRLAHPRPEFNVLGDVVSPAPVTGPEATPSLDAFIDGSHATADPGASLEAFVALRRRQGEALQGPTRGRFIRHLAGAGQDARAVAEFFKTMHDQEVIATAEVPAPLAAIAGTNLPVSRKPQWEVPEDIVLSAALCAERLGNYSAALTTLSYLRTHRPYGMDLQGLREKVFPLLAANSKPEILGEARVIPAPEQAPGVGEVRDFFDAHGMHSRYVQSAVILNLLELRIRRAFVAALAQAPAAAKAPTTTGLNAKAVPQTPTWMASEPAKWEILTDRLFFDEADKPRKLVSAESRGARLQSQLLQLSPPVQSQLVVGELQMDAKLVISKEALLKWCSAGPGPVAAARPAAAAAAGAGAGAAGKAKGASA